jgi:hypothetical protein
MNTTSVSISNFVRLFPSFRKTVNHFLNRNNVEVISGKAALLIECIIVSYTHELETGLFTVCYHGIPLHKQIALTQREILSAFKTAEDTFFMANSNSFSPEEIPFLETDKGKRVIEYLTSKKAVKVNQRGQKDRWNERRVAKSMNSYLKTGGACRFRGKSIRTVIAEEFERKDFCEFSVNEYDSNHSSKGPRYTFLTKGMDVIVEKDGTIGALSFNSHYLGCRVVRVN